MMEVSIVTVGELETNCYLLDIDNEVLIVDPGAEYQKIKLALYGRKVLGILITHFHSDHIGALKEFKDIPVYSFSNLEEKEYHIGKFNFEVMFNPGHTKDSVSYYFKEFNALFCGDFIFYHSVGRWDLATGNLDDLIKSVKKVRKLPEYTIIYPGHGRKTTMEEENKNNGFFNGGFNE